MSLTRSLTRKGLKAMGLTEEQVDSIVEAHTETVDGLAERLTEVQKELDALKATNDGGYKEKYAELKKE